MTNLISKIKLLIAFGRRVVQQLSVVLRNHFQDYNTMWPTTKLSVIAKYWPPQEFSWMQRGNTVVETFEEQVFIKIVTVALSVCKESLHLRLIIPHQNRKKRGFQFPGFLLQNWAEIFTNCIRIWIKKICLYAMLFTNILSILYIERVQTSQF